MDAWRAVLGPADINSRGIKMDLLPANVDQLAHPERMPERHQDQQPIAARIAALASSSQQLLDLGFRQNLVYLRIRGAILGQALQHSFDRRRGGTIGLQ